MADNAQSREAAVRAWRAAVPSPGGNLTAAPHQNEPSRAGRQPGPPFSNTGLDEGTGAVGARQGTKRTAATLNSFPPEGKQKHEVRKSKWRRWQSLLSGEPKPMGWGGLQLDMHQVACADPAHDSPLTGLVFLCVS